MGEARAGARLRARGSRQGLAGAATAATGFEPPALALHPCAVAERWEGVEGGRREGHGCDWERRRWCYAFLATLSAGLFSKPGTGHELRAQRAKRAGTSNTPAHTAVYASPRVARLPPPVALLAAAAGRIGALATRRAAISCTIHQGTCPPPLIAPPHRPNSDHTMPLPLPLLAASGAVLLFVKRGLVLSDPAASRRSRRPCASGRPAIACLPQTYHQSPLLQGRGGLAAGAHRQGPQAQGG